MMENLKNLWTEFDFHIPQNLNDISAGFLTACVILLALIVSVVAIVVLSSSKNKNNNEEEQVKYIPSKFIPEQKNEAIREKLVENIEETQDSETEQTQDNQTTQTEQAEEIQQEPLQESNEQYDYYNNEEYVEPNNLKFEKKEKYNFEDYADYTQTEEEKQQDEVAQYAIKSNVSYTTTFERIKTEELEQKPAPVKTQTQPQAQTQQRKSNPVKIVDGYAVLNSRHRENLEKAYSAAVRKCILQGSSDDLKVLLDVKKYITAEKVEQEEFKRLLTLISPK